MNSLSSVTPAPASAVPTGSAPAGEMTLNPGDAFSSVLAGQFGDASTAASTSPAPSADAVAASASLPGQPPALVGDAPLAPDGTPAPPLPSSAAHTTSRANPTSRQPASDSSRPATIHPGATPSASDSAKKNATNGAVIAALAASMMPMSDATRAASPAPGANVATGAAVLARTSVRASTGTPATPQAHAPTHSMGAQPTAPTHAMSDASSLVSGPALQGPAAQTAPVQSTGGAGRRAPTAVLERYDAPHASTPGQSPSTTAQGAKHDASGVHAAGPATPLPDPLAASAMRVTTDHPSPGVRPAETTSLTHAGAAPTASGHGPSAAHRPAGAPSAIGAAAPTAAAGTLLAPVIAPNPGPTVGHATPSGVAPPTQLPGVASQLLSVITPLRLAASGTQTLTVLLHPEALGDVRATVTTTGTDVIVRLAASTNEGAAALRAAAPDLHSGLSDGGQRASVFVGDPGGQNTAFGGGSPGFNAEQRPSSGSSDARTLDRGPAAVVSSATTHHAVPDSSRLLDLRL